MPDLPCGLQGRMSSITSRYSTIQNVGMASMGSFRRSILKSGILRGARVSSKLVAIQVTIVKPGTSCRYMRTEVACIPSGSLPRLHEPDVVQCGAEYRLSVMRMSDISAADSARYRQVGYSSHVKQ